MNTVDQLTQVFNDNFVTYYRSHVAHVNIKGRNFYSDHKLLGKIYEDLQSQIDTIAELLRSLDELMPNDITDIITDTYVRTSPVKGTSDELLEEVKTDLEYLKSCYETLIEVSEDEGHDEIANYAQDRVLALSKFIWMLNSTLD